MNDHSDVDSPWICRRASGAAVKTSTRPSVGPPPNWGGTPSVLEDREGTAGLIRPLEASSGRSRTTTTPATVKGRGAVTTVRSNRYAAKL
jgi:hypothetical protein